jgi:hypothetical protein
MAPTDAGLLTPYDIFDVSIFTLLGIDDASQQAKDELLADMLETVESRVFLRVMEALDDEAIERMDALTDAGDHAAVRTLLAEHDLDLAQLMAEETMFYKAELVETVQQREVSFAEGQQVAAV